MMFPVKQLAARCISRLPTWPPSLVFAQVLNRVLKPLTSDGTLAPLEGKQLKVCVIDFGFILDFSLRCDRFVPISPTPHPDLTLSATLEDFYKLATRQDDPDTLFFNRRLLIEGDTELGLIAKNSLDSMELPYPILSLFNLVNKLNALKVNRNSAKPSV